MSGTRTIFRREVGQYFASPMSYLIAFAMLLLTALYFNSDLALAAAPGIQRPTDPALIPTFLSFAMVFFAPLLTMRMLAEERREGTLELLLTAPVRDSDIVVGKFLSAWLYYSVILAITFFYQFILLTVTQPDLGHALCAYIGIWLYGGATLAVGLLFSALTENQIVAAFLSMTTLLFLWLGDLAGQIVANLDLARLIRELTLGSHFSGSFQVGLLRAEDTAYFAGIIVLMLFVTIRIVESNRWR
jgi:ABC-2 type transport system permease protein